MDPSPNNYIPAMESYPGNTPNRRQITLVIVLIYIVVIGMMGYFIASAIQIHDRTGILSVKASDKSAIITISENNHEAKILGTGAATVRLATGSYYLVADANGKQTSAVAHITAGKTASINLDLEHSTFLPSPETISYDNLDSLINSGITSDQITLIKQYFFAFKPTAQLVNIDPNSVQPGPHDPNTSIGFTLNFNVRVDDTSYKATLTYPDASSVQLQLFDDQGKVVFDSNQVH